MKESFIWVMLLISAAAAQDNRPNILWIMAEDLSIELACYGHPAVKTPHLDGLAAAGARYTQAFCTAPSCTPSRNAMLTGCYQTRTDTQDQRRKIDRLPAHIKPITHLLREAGYFTALGCGYSAKTDHNFPMTRQELFEGTDWRQRKPGQPFFAQVTLYETHRLQIASQVTGKKNARTWEAIRAKSRHPVNPAEVVLPPYFPDHPVTRLDWAHYLDAVEYVDAQVGTLLKRLEEEGLADNTVIFFIGDNGRCHLRGKCWLYDGGIRVPLIIRWPGRVTPGTVSDAMVSMIDVSATILDIAGVTLPAYLDGHPILGPRAGTRDHIFAARDLIDEVMDHIRCVRTQRFKYIRNYTPENGYNECDYVKKHRPMWPVLVAMHEQGQLNDVQELLFMKRKPVHELYDLQADPHEINNLAALPQYRETLDEMSGLLDRWIQQTGDQGLRGLMHDE